MSYDDALRHHVQRMVMADCGLPWDAVQWDEDDDICFLDAAERLVTVCLRDNDGATWTRVYIHAGHGLKRSAKLLREVNELNLSLVGARALLTPDGRLVLAAEVLTESLEPGELRRIVDILSENAARSGQMIQLMFGVAEVPDLSAREVEP